MGSNPVTGGAKIPVAAKVQTAFFGLPMTENNALNCQKSIAKTNMWMGVQVPVSHLYYYTKILSALDLKKTYLITTVWH